jgi:MFS family permease
MHPVLVGCLLGVANVAISGILIGLQQRAPETAGVVIALGLLPAILAGILIGALAAMLTGWHRVARSVLLVVPCVLMVVGLATGIGAIELIPVTLVPTIFLCLVLERRTRDWQKPPRIEPIAGEPRILTPIPLAMLLGAALVLVIMAALFAGRGHYASWFWQGYLPWGLILGAVLGTPFGVLVIWQAPDPPWTRRLTLLTTVGVLIAAVASVIGPDGYSFLLGVAVPACAACLVLERYTRLPDAVPAARAYKRA